AAHGESLADHIARATPRWARPTRRPRLGRTMRTRTLALVLFTSLSTLGADCDTATRPLRLGVAGAVPPINDTLNVARIRFVNATTTTVFDVLHDGVLETGNSVLRFGMVSTCVTVVASAPILDVRQTGSSVT